MLLHIDSSPRSGHTRRLSARFVERYGAAQLTYRDLAKQPPSFATAAFVEAALTAPTRRTPAMLQELAESDALVDELIAADLIVAGVPMYNFGPPAAFKAYIDKVVRVGRTFGFDRSRPVPYYPMLPPGKTLVILSARGDHDYEAGQANAPMNHVEPSIRSAFEYMGVRDIRSIAIEWDEFPRDPEHAASILRANAAVDALADELRSATARAARPSTPAAPAAP